MTSEIHHPLRNSFPDHRVGYLRFGGNATTHKGVCASVQPAIEPSGLWRLYFKRASIPLPAIGRGIVGLLQKLK
jgi:hypothetical protein